MRIGFLFAPSPEPPPLTRASTSRTRHASSPLRARLGASHHRRTLADRETRATIGAPAHQHYMPPIDSGIHIHPRRTADDRVRRPHAASNSCVSIMDASAAPSAAASSPHCDHARAATAPACLRDKAGPAPFLLPPHAPLYGEAALVLTPDAAGCRVCRVPPCHAISGPRSAIPRRSGSGGSRNERVARATRLASSPCPRMAARDAMCRRPIHACML